jgi:hypothetical protein
MEVPEDSIEQSISNQDITTESGEVAGTEEAMGTPVAGASF